MWKGSGDRWYSIGCNETLEQLIFDCAAPFQGYVQILCISGGVGNITGPRPAEAREAIRPDVEPAWYQSDLFFGELVWTIA
jgi:hypothetical protein